MKKTLKKHHGKLYNLLQKNIKNLKEEITIFNPVPSPISKIKDRYRWRMIIKCNLSNNIIDLINYTLEEYYKTNDKKVRIIADVNPNNMA